MRSIFLTQTKENIKYVYGEEKIEYIVRNFKCDCVIYNKDEVMANPKAFNTVDFIFSTWGMPEFSEQEIKNCFPNLKAIFYSAGTVQYFARPFLNCGIKVFSAWAANAIPVAEFTLAQILLANAGFFPKAQLMSRGEAAAAKELPIEFLGNYEVTVGIIGAGMIGRKVIELLKPFNIRTVAFDPFLSEEKAKELGTEKASIEELFATSEIVSNHLADNEQTRGMLNYSLFSKMKKGATFINTGRGAQVVEEDLAKLLKERKDIYALLDITCNEPPVEGHPFYEIENCILSPHIAGSKGNEVHRMADYMITECEKYISGEHCIYEVTTEMLKTMA